MLADALDVRGKGEPQQMGQAEDGLSIAMGIGGMDVGFHDVVVHQAVDQVGAFAIGGTDHQGVPQAFVLIDECVCADTLALPKVIE